VWVYFWVLYSIPPAIPYYLDYYSYLAAISGRVITLILFFFFKIISAILGPVPFHTNFRISSSMVREKPCLDFDRNCIKSTDQFGEN